MLNYLRRPPSDDCRHYDASLRRAFISQQRGCSYVPEPQRQILCAQCESEIPTGERVDLNNETHGSRLAGGADITGRGTVEGRSRD